MQDLLVYAEEILPYYKVGVYDIVKKKNNNIFSRFPKCTINMVFKDLYLVNRTQISTYLLRTTLLSCLKIILHCG